MLLEKVKLYLFLMRFTQPIGIFLLLLPTVSALWVASNGAPSLELTLVFCLGCVLMRATGCLINDYADRDLDLFVERTKGRPLAAGLVTKGEVKGLFVAMSALSASLLFFLNLYAAWIALLGIVLVIIYPYMKRITYMPQVFLGFTFGLGGVMAFVAQQEALPIVGWLLYFGNVFWIVAFDTLYALADQEDDRKIGIRSTALLFDSDSQLVVFMLQVAALLCWGMLGINTEYSWVYFCGLGGVFCTFVYQHFLLYRSNNRETALYVFKHNAWSGLCFFLGVVGELI